MAPLSFGLNITKKPSVARRPRLKGFAVESDESDGEDGEQARGVQISSFDEDVEAVTTKAPSAEATESSTPAGPPKLKKASGGLGRGISLSAKLQSDAIKAEAEKLDSSVFDYDAHYSTSSSAAADARKRAVAKIDAQTRTPKYVQDMASAAAVREKDQLRARDKLLQKEREAEGDEFHDKEKFVTAAYKEQQAAVQRAEEEEQKREEQEAKSGQAMQNFWRGRLQDEDQRYRDMTRDANNTSESVNVEEEKEKERETLERAKLLNAQGANIQINEEGLIADKRQLLSAGLNIVARPTSPNGGRAGAGNGSADRSQPQWNPHHRNAKQAMRERQSRMITEQLESAQKRAAEEEAEEVQKRERAAKSQKTEADISSARERYLQRKREAAAAKGKD